MARFVLDTHSLLFALAVPRRLGRRARAALHRVESGTDEAWIPAAVVAELVMLRELSRTDLGLPALKAAMEATPTVRFLALDLQQLDIFSTLGAIREPFDRLIVAAARSIDAKLVTKDAAVAETGLVEVVWD